LAAAFAELASFYQTVYLVEIFVKNSQKYSLKEQNNLQKMEMSTNLSLELQFEKSCCRILIDNNSL